MPLFPETKVTYQFIWFFFPQQSYPMMHSFRCKNVLKDLRGSWNWWVFFFRLGKCDNCVKFCWSWHVTDIMASHDNFVWNIAWSQKKKNKSIKTKQKKKKHLWLVVLCTCNILWVYGEFGNVNHWKYHHFKRAGDLFLKICKHILVWVWKWLWVGGGRMSGVLINRCYLKKQT